MAGEQEREAVLRTERPGRPGGARSPRVGRQLAIGDDLAPWHRAQGLRQGPLKRCAPGKVEGNVTVIRPIPGEVAVKPLHQIRHEIGTRT